MMELRSQFNGLADRARPVVAKARPLTEAVKSVGDRERWAARGASLVAKMQATKAVWFPPAATESGAHAASTAKRTTKKAPKKAATKSAKKTAKKPAGTTANKTAKKAAKETAKKTAKTAKPSAARKSASSA